MKTTKKQFDLFKKECKKWRKVFGLISYDVNYKLGTDEDNVGECKYPTNIGDRNVRLSFNSNSGSLTNYEIKKIAFHEVMELFLYKLVELAETRYITSQEVYDAIHEIIYTLEHVIFNNGVKNV